MFEIVRVLSATPEGPSNEKNSDEGPEEVDVLGDVPVREIAVRRGTDLCGTDEGKFETGPKTSLREMDLRVRADRREPGV